MVSGLSSTPPSEEDETATVRGAATHTLHHRHPTNNPKFSPAPGSADVPVRPGTADVPVGPLAPQSAPHPTTPNRAKSRQHEEGWIVD